MLMHHYYLWFRTAPRDLATRWLIQGQYLSTTSTTYWSRQYDRL